MLAAHKGLTKVKRLDSGDEMVERKSGGGKR